MRITIDLAEDIARHADPAREALEAVAIEGYRSGALSGYQARTLLGPTRFEFDRFSEGPRYLGACLQPGRSGARPQDACAA
jgi:hypothetical protein